MAMYSETEILRGQFEILPTLKTFFLSLTRKSLTYSRTTAGRCPCVGNHRSETPVSINLDDIYGAKAYRGLEGDVAGYFQVFSCPMLKKKRIRQKICFQVASFDCEEANIALAEKWVRAILWLVKEPEKNLESLIQGKIFLFHAVTRSPKSGGSLWIPCDFF